MPKSDPIWNGWMMLGAAALFLAVGAVLYVAFRTERHPETLCIQDKEHGQTIVFVDKTDMWNPNQSERLEKHVLDILDKDMKQEERLHVFSFGASFDAGFKAHYS